jgi:NTE family protein
VVEELQRSGVVIDRFGGASMGGVIASLFAEERSPDEVAEILDAQYVRTTPLAGRTIPLVALSRAVRAFTAVHQLHGSRRIEGLDIPFYCVSSDLVGQKPIVHQRGLVADAVSATQALPALVPPMKLDDHLLVDGSLFSNLPVEPMRATAEGPVIAVDVSGRLHPPRPPRSRLPALRRWIVGPAADWAPPITDTLLRSFLLGNAQSDAAARLNADLLIQPQLAGIGMMDFRALPRIRQLGRDAARALIESGDVPT